MRRASVLVLAILALASLGFEWEGRLTRLRRELGSHDPARRREVVQLLASYPAAEVREPLLAALEDPDAGVRVEAASAVGRVQLTEAVPRLLDWLDDPDADVRAGSWLPSSRRRRVSRPSHSKPRLERARTTSTRTEPRRTVVVVTRGRGSSQLRLLARAFARAASLRGPSVRSALPVPGVGER